ncbi:MAG TPA: hypothetical protein VIY48_06980 [Candidatus Paceibacterota bacterium]
MSVSEAKVKEKSSGKNSKDAGTEQPTQGWKGEMNRTQALAVSWTGLAVLAMNRQVKFYNDKKNNRLVIVLADSRVDVEPAGQGKKRLKLVDLLPANTPESVGSEKEGQNADSA